MGLKSKALSGFLWSSAGTLGNGLISFLVTIVLARILSPSDFALIALLTIFVAVCNVLVDSGFSQAIIRDEHLQNRDLSSVFIFNMLLSVGLYGILFFLSPYIASFYQVPELTFLARVVFLVIIFNSLTLIQNAILKKELKFAMVEKYSVLGSLCAGIISLVMVFMGAGIWALVANMVLMPFFRSCFLWKISKWRPSLSFSFLSIQKYFRFSIFLMLHNVIDVIIANLNSLLIGKIYTKNDLGYYSQACKIGNYIVTPFNSVLSKVVYPISAKLNSNQDKLVEGYRQIVGVVLFVTLPFMMFVIFKADDVMAFFFGEKWRASGVFLRLLAVLDMVQIIQNVFINAVIINGKTKVMFIFTVIRQFLRVALLLITLSISVKAIVLGFVMSSIVGSLLYIGLGMYYLRYKLKTMFIDNLKTFFATLLSILLVLLLGTFFENTVTRFLLQGSVMIVSYMLLNLLLGNAYYKELRLLLSSVKQANGK